MGSPYLNAHGLGIPVENAQTNIEIKGNGTYHVWVRTMNWAPGNWIAPGRFNISINNVKLKNTLGTKENWSWQYAGKIKINEPNIKIELEDISGFNGRCDAIYLSTLNKAPPDNSEDLNLWRKNYNNELSRPENIKDFDLVIVGGGVAGCAASDRKSVV